MLQCGQWMEYFQVTALEKKGEQNKKDKEDEIICKQQTEVGSNGTLEVHAELQTKWVLLHVDKHIEPDLSHGRAVGDGWWCALCSLCAHSIELEVIYRGLGGCGLGESRESETDRMWGAGKIGCWKLEKKRWGESLWLQLHFSDYMGHLELGIPFSVLNHKCLHSFKV